MSLLEKDTIRKSQVDKKIVTEFDARKNSV